MKITGIPAHELSRQHTILASTDNGTLIVTVSALSYVCAALEHYNAGNDPAYMARKAVAAIYMYSQAADAYKTVHSNG